MPSPMTPHYYRSNMAAEARYEAIREFLPRAVFVLMLICLCALSFSLTRARHEIAKLEATCGR